MLRVVVPVTKTEGLQTDKGYTAVWMDSCGLPTRIDKRVVDKRTNVTVQCEIDLNKI